MKEIIGYSGDRLVGSFSLSETTDNYLFELGLNPIRFSENDLVLVKDGKHFRCNKELLENIDSINELDVIEILPNGCFRHLLNKRTDDATLFITEKCNSNCIMCPYGESIRKDAIIPDGNYIYAIAMHFPQSLNHITITGGEPFMIKDNMFEILDLFKNRYYEQEVLLLTNGRIFCIDKYTDYLASTAPKGLVLGIPLHAHNDVLHDFITRTRGSFEQTTVGISKLLRKHLLIELRIVVSLINYKALKDIARFVYENYSNIFRVVFVGLEMTGNAAKNKESVWVPYSQSAKYVEIAAEELIQHGIPTRIYNYPLCAIQKKYWSICYKSISDYKIRYVETCDKCVVKKNCGGIFNGTIALEESDVKPIIG